MRVATLISAGFFVVAGVSCCSSDAVSKDKQEFPVLPKSSASSLSPEAVVRQFLTWYRPKRESFGNLPIVPAWLTDDGDTTDIYKVDFKVAEQYLDAIRLSGFVSEKYLADERTQLQRADSTMRAERQSAGPPQGLEYNRIVFSQNPDADLEKLLRTKPAVTISGDKARVYFPQLPKSEDLRDGADLEFLLVPQQGKWVVDNIRSVFINQ